MNIKKYLKVWWILALNSFQRQLVVRWAVVVLLLGKFLRFFIFTFFIVTLVSKTNALAGYSLNETIFFYLTFNLVDITAQLLFREVYRFRPTVVNGTFDFSLIKPINPLFKSLTSGPDILDFITLIPLIGAIIYFMNILGVSNIINISTYLLLVGIGFLIGLSFHIFVLSLGVVTTEIDHAVQVYRDITSMGRMPIDIYREPIRGVLTFVIPVGIMMSFPVKSLLGILSPLLIIYAVVFALTFFFLSLKAWTWAIQQYSSASS